MIREENNGLNCNITTVCVLFDGTYIVIDLLHKNSQISKMKGEHSLKRSYNFDNFKNRFFSATIVMLCQCRQSMKLSTLSLSYYLYYSFTYL